MDRSRKVSAGDILIRFGKILKIAKINDGVVEMSPFFGTKINQGLTYSIPLENLFKNQIRLPVSKDKLNQLVKTILIDNIVPIQINVVDDRSDMTLYDLEKSLRLIKTLWIEKQNNNGFLPGGKLNLFQQALVQASDELAVVKGIMPPDAKIFIQSTLKKNASPALNSAGVG